MSSIIAVPSGLVFEKANIKLSRTTIVLRSRYTGKRQTLVLPYALWQFSGTVPKRDAKAAAPIRAFLAQLQGRANIFRLPVPGHTAPLSGYTGPAGLVIGAANVGNALPTDGWSASAALLTVGDYFTVNDELKMVVGTSVASNGSGIANITFEPRLRRSPPDNAVINIYNPTMLVSLASDDVEWDLESPVNHDISFTAIEAYE